MAEIFKDARKKEYLNAESADKPLKSPIPHATLIKARGYRKQRLVQKVVEHDCAAILLYDPLNIRYATDVSNMQLWMTHNPSRMNTIVRVYFAFPGILVYLVLWLVIPHEQAPA